MFRRTHGVGERLTPSRNRRVCPVLFLLEDRASPSSWPGSGDLLLPPDVYLPAIQDVRTHVESPVALLARPATRDGSSPVAGLDTNQEPASAARWSRELAAFGDTNPAQLTNPAGSSSGWSNLHGSFPTATEAVASADLSVGLGSGGGTDQPLLRNGGHEPRPIITEFHVSQNDDGSWLLSGHVQSSFAPLLSIRFDSAPRGSMSSMDGQTTGVDDQGNFQFPTRFQPCEHGMVTAKTTKDPNGHASKMVEDYVSQTGCGN